MDRRRLLGRLGAALIAAKVPRLVRAQAGPAREVVDAAGRRVQVPAQCSRIFAAGPPASILVFAAAPDTLLGWAMELGAGPRAFLPARYADLPVTGRLTGRGGSANLEAVIALRADAVVDYGSVTDTYISLADRVQKQTGIPVLLLDGAFDRIPESLRLVGSLAGTGRGADDLARYARGIVDDVTSRVARVPKEQRPRIYYGRGPRGLETGLAGSINLEVIDRMGATNVAAELGRGGLVQVSIEQVLGWNPDVILTTDANFFASVRRDSLWRGVKAVKEGRVHLAPSEPFGWIDFPPSVNRLAGLHWLGRILYPEVFDDDLHQRVREFYARFYHQPPSAIQLEALVATARRAPPG